MIIDDDIIERKVMKVYGRKSHIYNTTFNRKDTKRNSYHTKKDVAIFTEYLLRRSVFYYSSFCHEL